MDSRFCTLQGRILLPQGEMNKRRGRESRSSWRSLVSSLVKQASTAIANRRSFVKKRVVAFFFLALRPLDVVLQSPSLVSSVSADVVDKRLAHFAPFGRWPWQARSIYGPPMSRSWGWLARRV